MLNVQPIKLSDRRLVKLFLQLPFRVYEHIPQWVPPLAVEAGRYLSSTNPFYRHSEAAFSLACDGPRAVGR